MSTARGIVPQDVLVAEVDGEVAGYVQVRPASLMPAHAHVQEVTGLGVHPDHQGQGIAGALLAAAVAEARRRGARRLTLRVLGHNDAARRCTSVLTSRSRGYCGASSCSTGWMSMTC